ncbi:MAG: hypothetical protein ACR2FN_05320 [Chitinophagaceae bacterium]
MKQRKLLFTPGPLTTSPTVKQAMLEDVGSRDFEFINAVKESAANYCSLHMFQNKKAMNV